MRWLSHISYACTYHHRTLRDKAISRLPRPPKVPFVRYPPSQLNPPRRDPPHAHTNFDFGWGVGPLLDSFKGMYHLLGSHTRVPGHEDVEIYDEEEKHYHWKPIRDIGETNEYIHPIVHYRSIARGWDKHSPLKDGWVRDHWRGTDGKARFWWYKEGEKDKIVLPEWAILPDQEGKPNFERAWYLKCEKSQKTVAALRKVEEYSKDDFLEALDRKIDFGFDDKPQNQWP